MKAAGQCLTARELPMEGFQRFAFAKIEAREQMAMAELLSHGQHSIERGDHHEETRDCALGGRWSVVYGQRKCR
jgi:hypothetical protein